MEFRNFGSLKILLAGEDTSNQSPVEKILVSLGHEVIIAGDGTDAVQKARSQQLDIIFWAPQMPVTDAIIASRTIRSFNMPEGSMIGESAIPEKISTCNVKDKSGIPIIALINNHSGNADAEYEHSGINSYISAPHTGEKLLQAISAAHRNQNHASDLNPIKTPVSGGAISEPDELLYDLSLIRSTVEDDNEFIQKLLGVFIDFMPDSINEIITAANNENLEQVRKTAHKMKSSIDLVGIHSLKDTITNLEFIAADDNNLGIYIEKLDTTIKKVIAQLQKLV